VIDPPAAADKRLWPKRKQIVMSSTIAAFFWVCLVLMIRKRYRDMPHIPASNGEGGSGKGGDGE